MRLNLIGNEADRQLVLAKEQEGKINLVNVLKKYGDVVDYMTEPMVAKLFKTEGSTTIKLLATRHEDELKEYGYRVITGQELKEYKERDRVTGCNSVKPNARSLRLYPIKAVILIGMMLTESEVAEQLRSDIMDILFGNEVAIPTESTIRNVVSTELDKRVPQMIGCKDAQVKAIVKAIKGNLFIKTKKQDYANYETVVAWLLGKYGVYKLEDIPFSDDLYVEIKDFVKKLHPRQKRLF